MRLVATCVLLLLLTAGACSGLRAEEPDPPDQVAAAAGTHGDEAPAGARAAARDQPDVTPAGEWRALMVFVRFRDDTSTSDCSRGLQEWPVSQAMPRLADYVLARTPAGPFPDSSLTAYYHQQSRGLFTLYGDSFGYVTREPEVAYRRGQSEFIDRSRLTREILEHLSGEIDFSQYDRKGDGHIDYLFVVLRNTNHLVIVQNRFISGISSVGLNVREGDDLLQGMRMHGSRSGSYIRYQRVDVARDNVYLLAHEIGHDLFNGNRYFGNHLEPIEGNLVPYIPPPGRAPDDHEYADRMNGYANMQGGGRATERVWGMHLSAAERSYLNAEHDDSARHWIACADPEDGQTYRLRDLYASGDCVRLRFETSPTVTELFLQHIDGRSVWERPRTNHSVIEAACPGCRAVESGIPRPGMLVELSRRNAELPFRAVRDPIPADNALRSQASCDLFADQGPRLAETFANDFWRPDNRRQLSPWTRPNVFGHTFLADVPAHFLDSGWHVIDDLRYGGPAGDDRAEMVFDYFRAPFQLPAFTIREDSWMGAESDGIAFDGHVTVASGVTLVIEDGATVHFRGGLTVAAGGAVSLRGGGRALGPDGRPAVR